jgi:hypothetical protein
MKDFMFIYKGGDHTWMANASDEEKQAVMAKWGEWMELVGKKGQLVSGGSPLSFDGKRVTKDGVVTDVSASELKELVTGYTLIKAASYAAAAELAKTCPIFLHDGTTVEVRAVVSM